MGVWGLPGQILKKAKKDPLKFYVETLVVVVEQRLLLFYFSDWLDRSEEAAVVLDGYQQAGRQTDRLAGWQ